MVYAMGFAICVASCLAIKVQSYNPSQTPVAASVTVIVSTADCPLCCIGANIGGIATGKGTRRNRPVNSHLNAWFSHAN